MPGPTTGAHVGGRGLQRRGRRRRAADAVPDGGAGQSIFANAPPGRRVPGGSAAPEGG